MAPRWTEDQLKAYERKRSTHAVRRVETNQPQPTPAPALAGSALKRQGCQSRLVVIITLCALRHRLLDDDNNVASFKPLRDAIAETLKVDDGDKRLKWQCQQIETRGEECVVVKIETKPRLNTPQGEIRYLPNNQAEPSQGNKGG